MDHKRWITGLLALILCFGLINVGFAETYTLYEKVKNELAQLKELERTSFEVVRVQPGDSVYKLAQQFGTDVKTIALANDLSDPSLIHVGDELRIPQEKGFYYQTKKGESLEGISKEYGVSLDEIRDMNPTIDDEETLANGEEIFLIDPERWPKPKKSGIQLASKKNKKKGAKETTSRKQSETASTSGSRRLLGNFTLTAYTAGPESTGKSPGHPAYGITASGAKVQEGVTIAADPNVIPMGSTVYIEGIGTRMVQDTGGAIKGNRIDVYIPELSKARQFGVKKGVKVYVIDD